ncbi:fibronectin type III domain-containing protein [Nocardiopsis sp. NPDC006938]|uniref:fibronectin type III domain-containing protein n=1 Tax=Nocardiopsis sp. NPDC006938 TaxID=3364337 RepID=UPI0036CA55EC
MAFDAKQYRKTVLIPLEKDKDRMAVLQQAIRDVQGEDGATALARLDVAGMFAVEPSMTGAELERHLGSVEAAFNSPSIKNRRSAQLLKKLLELLRTSGAAVADPAFWSGMSRARTEAVRAQLDGFARAVAQEHPLRVVLPEQVREFAAGTGLGGVSEDDLADALSAHGVRVAADFEVPRVRVPAAVRVVTDYPEFRTLVDVVTRPERPEGIRVVDELAFGEPARVLGPKDVARARELLQQQEARVEEGARQAAQNGLAALAECASPADLHALVLSSLAETVEGLLRRGQPRVTVHEELCRRGLDQTDAARLVTKLSASTKVLSANDVAERLADGALGEARRLLDSLPEPEEDERAERERLARRVEEAERKKGRSVVRYDAAVKQGDYAAAAAALREALSVDTRDEELRNRLQRLPPLPPANLSLRADGRALVASWSADGEGTARYAVVRTTGGVPANPRDGELLADGHTGTVFRDERVPVGTRVRYSVFATRDGVLHSAPATDTCEVLPPPFDLDASAGSSQVSLSWGVPSEALGVVVTQTAPDGTRTTHRPTAPGQTTVTGLTLGTRYRFSVAAVYLSDDGRQRESAAVTADATPRGAIRAVDDLRIDSSPDGHQASWGTVTGYPVEVWALPPTARIERGTRLPRARLTGMGGRRLTLRQDGGADGRTVCSFDLLPEVSLLVPVTVDGDGGLVGTARITGSAPQVRTPTAERLGGELRLSWEWPEGDHQIEVAWRAGGRPVTRRVSRTAYNDGGGVRVPDADSISDITLSTVVRAGDREWSSAAVPVPLSGPAPKVRYSLEVKRSWMGGKGSVRVTAESPDFRGRVPAVTVLKEAKFMPGDASDGTVVDRRELDFTDRDSLSYELRLGRVASPFWVRVFVEPGSGARLQDPPTSQMRG